MRGRCLNALNLPFLEDRSVFKIHRSGSRARSILSWFYFSFYTFLYYWSSFSKNNRCVTLTLPPKASACNAGDRGSIPGLGRSPGEGNGNPIRYFCLENPMDGEAWRAAVHGVAESGLGLSDFTFTFKKTKTKKKKKQIQVEFYTEN